MHVCLQVITWLGPCLVVPARSYIEFIRMYGTYAIVRICEQILTHMFLAPAIYNNVLLVISTIDSLFSQELCIVN